MTVEPLRLAPDLLREFSRWLMLFESGGSRDSAGILSIQRRETRDNGSVRANLETLRDLAETVRDELERADFRAFGKLLDEGWQIKRGLVASISSSHIDDAYAAARASGAIGGKLCGAGGGGYLLLCCPPEARRHVSHALTNRGLRELPFSIDRAGVRKTAETSNGVLSYANRTRY